MQKRLICHNEFKQESHKKNKPIAYYVLEEFLANENADLNRETSRILNNRDKEEQIIDMEEARFVFFASVSCKKYNYSSMYIGLSDDLKQMISSMNRLNHSDQFLKLLDRFQTDICNIRRPINCKVTVPYITELTMRLLFAAFNPTHDNNKSDGVNNLRSQYLAKEIDPPLSSIWSFQIKPSALTLLVRQIFEYCRFYQCIPPAQKNPKLF
jgi:hypothetical protein